MGNWGWIAFTLLGGLACLAVGAELLVGGATALARRFGMSELLIGLTLVAFGTSTPELMVSVDGALRGSAEVAVGNVVGSNAFNGMLIIGLCALVRPLSVQSSTVWKEIPFSLLAALVVAALANDALLGGAPLSTVSRGDGLVLLGFFCVFLVYLAEIYRRGAPTPAGQTEAPRGPLAAAGLAALGLLLLVAGGTWSVDGAVAAAHRLGVSESLIAVTVLAGGTSLPELVTSLAATRRGQVDLAVGNVVGSNIFNVFLILGAAATIQPLRYDARANLDVAAAALGALVLFLAMFTGSRKRVDRWEGALLLALYAGYLVLRFHLEGS